MTNKWEFVDEEDGNIWIMYDGWHVFSISKNYTEVTRCRNISSDIGLSVNSKGQVKFKN